MIAVPEARPAQLETLGVELRKIPAFVRRDFLVAWSYRTAFVSDVLNLISLTLVFYFIGLLVDGTKLPTYGGSQVTYIEFAAVGLALGVFMQFGLDRVAGAVRGEQLMGTLESLVITPTAPATLQIGSVAFDFLYLPIRTILFLVALAAGFGLHLHLGGIAPATAILLLFIPFVWGLGVASAALVLTFRRGSGLVGLGATGLALVSGVYFPIELLPGWITDVARHNPIAVAIDGMREAVLGGVGWGEIAPELALLGPTSLASLAAGFALFKLALRR